MSITRLALFVLIAAVIGFAGTYLLLSGPMAAGRGAASWPADLAEATAVSRRNLEQLDRIRADLDARKQKGAGVPVSAGYADFDTIASAKTAIANFGSTAGRFLYLSPDGKDYKLIAIGTGDCFNIKRTRPELVDPVRSHGKVDCYAYGYWSKSLEMR